MILKRIYDEYGFNIESLLIKEYKRLNLSTNELNVLLVLFGMPSRKRTFSLTSITKKVDYNQNDVTKIVESLLEKNFIAINLEVNNKKEREVFDLDGTFKNITKLFKEDELENRKVLTSNNITETIELLENKVGRMLKSDELERIRTWYETYCFDHKRIIDVINTATKSINVLYVEKVLSLNLGEVEKLDSKTEKVLDDIFKKM